MTHGERVRRALSGEPVDRPPLVLWHHFRPAGSPEALAAATLAFAEDFDFDICKIMPDLPYPEPAPLPLGAPADWRALPQLGTRPGESLGGMPEAVRLVRRGAPGHVVLMTVFSPLAIALRFAGGAAPLLGLLRSDPDAVLHGLRIIAENSAALCQAALASGADGVYFATAGQGDALLNGDEVYGAFGRPFDLAVLEACAPGWCNIAHMHGPRGLRWRLAADYPVQVFSWSDRQTGIPLDEVARALPGRVVMGGIDEAGPVVRGDESALRVEMRDAVGQTGGRRLILAGGCSVPDDIPAEHLRLARALVDRLDA